MASRFPSVDVSALKTMSIADRMSKVSVGDFGRPLGPGSTIHDLLGSLPEIMAGRSIRTVIDRVAGAHKAGRAVVLAMGAHVIKCGLSPFICDLMRRKVVTALAMNGAGAIHDFEIAYHGATSEDVMEGISSGTFGMATQTAGFLNDAARCARQNELGFGEALGSLLVEKDCPNLDVSLLATASRCGIPVTVHVSIGSDIVHMHPSADGAAIGDASMRDFRILTEAMSALGQGGVLFNVGSAVVLPEVLLKALTVLANLQRDLSGMTGVNLDFVQHYRSNQQVVARVAAIGGEGISLTGHHEIMIPLISAGVIDRLGEVE